MNARPFCSTKPAREAFDRWRTRLDSLGVELGEADGYLLGLLATREARLEELAAELVRSKDDMTLRLRLVAAERMAAQDMARALDQAERHFGSRVEAMPAQAVATGTGGRVVSFPTPAPGTPASVTGQRIVAVLARSRKALTKAELRRRVPGNQGDFLRGLREAEQTGAAAKDGAGTRSRPFRYRGVRA